MSIVRMSPEFIATLTEGLFEIVRGAAVPGAKVRDVTLDGWGSERAPYVIVIDVDDGLDINREIVFQKVGREEGERYTLDQIVAASSEASLEWSADSVESFMTLVIRNLRAAP